MTSPRMRLVFALILQILNLLNRGTRFRDSAGFKLDTLPKLKEFKVSHLSLCIC